MESIDTGAQSRHYLAIFRNHVLSPVASAVNRVEQEQREIETERDAFAEFTNRVKNMPTAPATSPAPIETTPCMHRHATHTDALRRAYEDTVMAVPHFDTVYAESVEENLIAEVGPEFATLFAPSTTVSLTETHKDRLLAAIRTKIDQRDRFHTSLEDERDSLLAAYEELETLLADLDSTIMPSWYHGQFQEQVDDLMAARQAEMKRRSSPSRADGHDLCDYLYADETWTYPVLTAVGRLLDVTEKRPSNS